MDKNNMLCSRCKKRLAVIYMTRMENGQTVSEGLCLPCAKELGLKPVDDRSDGRHGGGWRGRL